MRAAVVCMLALTGCGYVGPPQYPALNIPARVSDLSVIERGSRLEIQFTTPTMTTEGLALPPVRAVDLRVGPTPSGDFHIESWEPNAEPIAVTVPQEMGTTVSGETAAAPFVGKEVVVAVRLENKKGRYSEWSNLARIVVARPLATPSGFRAEATQEGVVLRWTGDAAQYRVFRGSAKAPQPVLTGTANAATYLDKTAQFGETYQYYVQGTASDVESDPAGPVSITPEDVFPPAVPTGLAVAAGVNTLELTWTPDTDADLAGYNVYRSAGGGAWEKTAGPLPSANYSDSKVESGKTYRYAVTAIDQRGNESQRSAPVETTAP